MTEDKTRQLVTINENKGTVWRRGKGKREELKAADGGTGETNFL